MCFTRLVINALGGRHAHIPMHEQKRLQERFQEPRCSATHAWFKKYNYIQAVKSQENEKRSVKTDVVCICDI